MTAEDAVDGPESLRAPAWRYRLRRLLRRRTLFLDDFRIVGYRADIPKHLTHEIARGDYEAAERQVVTAVLVPGDRVLEIGACVGIVTLTAARIVGADNVLAYEPNPAAAAVARENLSRNGLPARVVEKAVGPRAERARLRIGPDNWLGAGIGRVWEGGQEVEIEVEAIREAVGSFAPTVLILDAEGEEAEILRACPLDAVRAVIVEIHRDMLPGESIARLSKHLLDQGFVRNDSLGAKATEVWLRKPPPE